MQISCGRDLPAFLRVSLRRPRQAPGLVDLAERPEHEGEQDLVCDQLVLAKAKGELPILNAVEDRQRPLEVYARAGEVALKPARHAIDALGDGRLGRIELDAVSCRNAAASSSMGSSSPRV